MEKAIRNWNCERKAGYLSVWFCNFSDETTFWQYFADLFIVDDQAAYIPGSNLLRDEYMKMIQKLFVPENFKRPFESVFRDHFYEGGFNNFEYDFGVTFDPDFWIGNYSKFETDDIAGVLGEWGDDYLVNPIKKCIGERLPKRYNCFFAISSCIYNGFIKAVQYDTYSVEFMGVVQEDTYSDHVAEKWNG